MKARTWAMLAAVVVLGTCYVLFYTEWLNPDPIQIQAQVRDMAPRQMFRDRAANAADLRKEREERAAAMARRTAGSNAPSTTNRPGKDAPGRGNVAAPAEPKPAQRGVERARQKALAEERAAARAAEATAGRFEGLYPVVFALDGEYQLTEVRVIEVTPSVPGKGPKIVWHLNTPSNSVPTKALLYGRIPKGMKPKTDRSKAEKLLPGIEYRLEVKAGRYKGSTTFKAKEFTPPADAGNAG